MTSPNSSAVDLTLMADASIRRHRYLDLRARFALARALSLSGVDTDAMGVCDELLDVVGTAMMDEDETVPVFVDDEPVLRFLFAAGHALGRAMATAQGPAWAPAGSHARAAHLVGTSGKVPALTASQLVRDQIDDEALSLVDSPGVHFGPRFDQVVVDARAFLPGKQVLNGKWLTAVAERGYAVVVYGRLSRTRNQAHCHAASSSRIPCPQGESL